MLEVSHLLLAPEFPKRPHIVITAPAHSHRMGRKMRLRPRNENE